MKLSIIQQELQRKYLSLGKIIARYPLHFVIIPVIISLTLITGLIRIKINRDNHYLFTAENGKIDQNEKLIENTFPTNTSNLFDIGRVTNTNGFILLCVVPRDGYSLFREAVIGDLLLLDTLIRNISIVWMNEQHSYNTLCGKKQGKCIKSSLFEISENYKKILNGKYKIKYPVDIDHKSYTFKQYALSLGGVDTDVDGYVVDAKAMRLMYGLDVSNKSKINAIEKWREEVYKIISRTEFHNIDLSLISDEGVTEELKKFTDCLMPIIPIEMVVIILFCLVSSMTDDCIRSKPWLGFSACISAALAVASGFGLMFHVGVEYTDYTTFLIYSVLVLEIDDAFVLIAAWQRTNPEHDVEKRMADTFSQAGVSVTVTSFTNFASFCVGISSPFPVISNFCSYGAISMFFTYLYQITFFGGCMALSGYREEKMLHPFICNCKQSERQPACLDNNNIDHREFFIRKFQDRIGFFLTFNVSKLLVLTLFIINLAAGLSGLWFVKSGNVIEDVFSYDSGLRRYLDIQFKHFSKFYTPVQIIIDKPMDYADKNIQHSIEDMIQKFEDLSNIADSTYTVSWLKYYKQFSSHTAGKFLLRGYNLSDKQDFVDGLRNVFLKFPAAEQFKQDIAFNENYTDIIASRFLLISKDIESPEIELDLMKSVFNLADLSPLQVKIYAFNYRHLEQSVLINKQTIQTGAIMCCLVCIISFVFLPDIKYTICVSLVVCFVIFEVIGYMSFWNVKIDLAFLSCFVLSVGFSINHPTHMSYSFFMSKGLNPNERIKKSLNEVAYPIIQGVLSTVLGILIVAFQPFYTSLAASKLICLFAIQTAFHSLFVVPVLLFYLSNIHQFFLRIFKSDPKADFAESCGETFIIEQLVTENIK